MLGFQREGIAFFSLGDWVFRGVAYDNILGYNWWRVEIVLYVHF